MRKSKFLHRVVSLFMILLILLGVAGIAIYPFDNRNINIHFITNQGVISEIRNNEEITSGNCREFEIELPEGSQSIVIKKLHLYGDDETMLLKEISYNEFYGNIESLETGDMQWSEDGVIISGEQKINFYMSESFAESLNRLSASRFLERIIFGGLYICTLVFIVFFIAIIRERNTAQNWNNHGPVFEIKKFIGDIKRYRQYMVYAARTDLKAEVANSYLNRLWWLLEPFFNMIVYVIVFGGVMGNSVENYSTFIFSALLMWNFFSKTVNYSVKLVRNNKDIITKVYIPKFIILCRI